MYIWPFERSDTASGIGTLIATSSAMPSSKKSEFYSSDKDGTLPRPVAAGKAPSGSSYYSFGSRAPRRSRKVFAAILFITLFMVWAFYPALSTLVYRPGIPSRSGFAHLQEHIPTQMQQRPNPSQLPDVSAQKEEEPKHLVPLEAHIMSKCPDAQDCLVDLVVPAMQRASAMVNWTLSFIGEVENDDTVRCKHGEEECLGNIMMLCAAKLYPDPKISLGFSTCMIRDYEQIPSRNLVESCALEHAVDFDRLNACVSEEGDGLSLLKASVLRSKNLGVKYSCTVRLNGKTRCIRDGGEWVNCDDGSEPGDLIRDIDALYKKS